MQIQTDEDEPTAGTVTLTANYVLTDAKTGGSSRPASARSPHPSTSRRQEFASYRAQIDAENRAARELAEMLSLSIAQDLVRHGKKT